MADSIERIADEIMRQVQSGPTVDWRPNMAELATRLRALSPAGGDWVAKEGDRALGKNRGYALAAPPQQEPTPTGADIVGIASIPPGGDGATTRALFDARTVPAGTKLYTSGQTPTGAGVYGLRQGNWPHPDGGRIVGWVVEPDDVERMKADAFCLPRELAECLVNLRNAHRTLTATSAGTTGDAEELVSDPYKLPELPELPEPAAYAVRESIGDNLWFFTTKRAEAHDSVGYRDSVEPLYTADQMREYARRARGES